MKLCCVVSAGEAKLALNMTTVRSTRSSSRAIKETPVKEAVNGTVKELVKNVTESKNKKLKKAAAGVVKQEAVLPLKTQNSIIRTVLDRLDGKSVILHGIDRTKS